LTFGVPFAGPLTAAWRGSAAVNSGGELAGPAVVTFRQAGRRLGMGRLVAIAAAFLLAACGAVPGIPGQLPPPSPPTSALAKWSDFPVNAQPRPIIWFGDIAEEIGEGQFTSNEAKIAWMCHKFVLAKDVE